MSRENRLWGAPRIHDELLKLGFEVAESTVSKYTILLFSISKLRFPEPWRGRLASTELPRGRPPRPNDFQRQ